MNKQKILILFCILLILLVIGIFTARYSSKEGLDNFDAINIPVSGIIPDGYYKIDDTKMKKIPYGYTTNTEKTELLPNTQATYWKEYSKKKDNIPGSPVTDGSTIENSKYNANNYDLLYHDSEETIKYQSGLYGSEFGTTMVLDSCGNKILIPYSEMQGFPTYYKPGSYKYGASTYIPNYEASVLLSKSNMKTKKKYEKSSEKKYQKNVIYLKPQFISLSTYLPNNTETIFSSKTSGIETTSLYNCK